MREVRSSSWRAAYASEWIGLLSMSPRAGGRLTPTRIQTSRAEMCTTVWYDVRVRTLTSVLGNSQRLDGGAMFGNAPRALWERWIAPDTQNRIPLACRCLVMRDRGRT